MSEPIAPVGDDKVPMRVKLWSYLLSYNVDVLERVYPFLLLMTLC